MGWLVGWLIGGLVGWLVGLLVGFLVGWLCLLVYWMMGFRSGILMFCSVCDVRFGCFYVFFIVLMFFHCFDILFLF